MGTAIARAVALTTLLGLAFGPSEAAAQRSGGAATVSVDRFVGAWELVDWRTTSSTGTVNFPYGENAKGQISYTSDGRMSAHLMRPPEDASDAPTQYLGYWGAFSLDTTARTVTHHVVGSDQANWIGSDQVRGFSFEADGSLILSAGSNRLTWVRVRPPA